MIILDFAPFPRQNIRPGRGRIALGWSLLARPLASTRPLIGATALWHCVVLAIVTPSSTIVTDRPSRITTYLPCSTAMPTN